MAQPFIHNFRVQRLFKSDHFEQLVCEEISGPPGGAFLEKKLGSHGWGAYFSSKNLGCMAGVRIFREKAWAAWLGRVFFEKKLGSHGWGAYFSRKSLGCMAGARISPELGDSVARKRKKWAQQFIHSFRVQLLFESCHFEQLVCGGGHLQNPLEAHFLRKSLGRMAGARIF